MNEILRQLGHLFVRTVPTVLFVFFLLVILDRLFFRPILGVLKERESKTRGALERAHEQAAAADAKAREYEETFQAARQEVYRRREADRRDALAEREKQLAEARNKAEATLKEALDGLGREVDSAKQELEKASAPLAAEITEAVLSGKEPAGGWEGARN
jgi:F-type H+-transporting ATPase subunit b